MQLTQKETSLLKDMKDHEKLCVEKYKKHANCANDSQLKNLLNSIAQTEQEHLDTLTQIENGTVPQMPAQSSQPQSTFTATYGVMENADKKNDCFICTDLLSTEKQVSQLYNTCVFEFKDAGIRDVLNHIQKEEQQHGKQLYDYMEVNSMYA